MPGCDRRFVADPKTGPVPEATKDLVRRLLAEHGNPGHRAGRRGVPVVAPRVRQRAVSTGDPTSRDRPKKCGPVVIEADELWSFVGSKGDVHWVWVALDLGTRRVLAMVLGDRSAATAQRLWDALPRGTGPGSPCTPTSSPRTVA
ncbi:hypothetical protein J8F10_19820 [Gemmata sp. G18]|uniref:Transposase n=1 Tax=Gemmata palustris TaxID=2822762 RepID=A0ABS5BUW1_9BACT|nr:hypothetical protein [Gemmata palustris]